METNKETFECCPPFDPIPWNEKVFDWDNKKFIKDKVFTIFYMPMNFGKVMQKLDKITRQNNVEIPDYMCLSDHTSKWNMDVYLAVDRPVPAVENTSLSGKFYIKVYEGPYKDTAKWCKDFEDSAKEKKLEIKKQYMWYTTCPKCSKKYGKNYVVIVALVSTVLS